MDPDRWFIPQMLVSTLFVLAALTIGWRFGNSDGQQKATERLCKIAEMRAVRVKDTWTCFNPATNQILPVPKD